MLPSGALRLPSLVQASLLLPLLEPPSIRHHGLLSPPAALQGLSTPALPFPGPGTLDSYLSPQSELHSPHLHYRAKPRETDRACLLRPWEDEMVFARKMLRRGLAGRECSLNEITAALTCRRHPHYLKGHKGTRQRSSGDEKCRIRGWHQTVVYFPEHQIVLPSKSEEHSNPSLLGSLPTSTQGPALHQAILFQDPPRGQPGRAWASREGRPSE